MAGQELDLAARIRHEAAITDRPGQMRRLEAIADEVDRLRAKFDAPCGTCHPCTEWSNQTWVNAGERLPSVHEWQEMKARIKGVDEAVATFCHGEQQHGEHVRYCLPLLAALDGEG